MNIDTILLIVLAFFFLMGFIRGFIREIGAVCGFFVSLWLASVYHPLIIPSIKPAFAQWPFIASAGTVIAAYFVTFLVAQILFGLLIKILDFIVRRLSPIPFLKTTNRLAGGLVGLVEGVLLSSAVLYVFVNIPFSRDLTEKINASKLASTVVKASRIIIPLLPDASKLTPQLLPSLGTGAGSLDLMQLEKQLKNLKLDAVDFSKIDLGKLPFDIKTLPPQIQELIKFYQDEQAAQKKR